MSHLPSNLLANAFTVLTACGRAPRRRGSASRLAGRERPPPDIGRLPFPRRRFQVRRARPPFIGASWLASSGDYDVDEDVRASARRVSGGRPDAVLLDEVRGTSPVSPDVSRHDARGHPRSLAHPSRLPSAVLDHHADWALLGGRRAVPARRRHSRPSRPTSRSSHYARRHAQPFGSPAVRVR